MGVVFIYKKLVKHMRDSGLTINHMEKGSKYLLIGRFLKANFKMEKKKGMGSINGMINQFTRVCGQITNLMDMENIPGLMVGNIKENGSLI